MKLKYNINLPQKSIFGFKVLSSLQSSIATYILIFIGEFLNPFFGISKIQLIAGSFFNIILDLSILILTLNLYIKRKQIQKIYFISLNTILFLYLPFSFYNLFINIRFLFFSIQKDYQKLILQKLRKQESPTSKIFKYLLLAFLIFNKQLGFTARIVFNSISPSLPSLRIFKKHFLLFPEIMPGQIAITPKENPKINIGIILR